MVLHVEDAKRRAADKARDAAVPVSRRTLIHTKSSGVILKPMENICFKVLKQWSDGIRFKFWKVHYCCSVEV